MPHKFNFYLLLLLLPLMLCGCNATYIPISWGMGEKVQHLSQSDPTLTMLFARFDPTRETLRVPGESFEQVMMPSEVKYHLGAYRADSKLIYRNLYYKYTDIELRDLMVHEFAHHIWFNFMNADQRHSWAMHLRRNPSPLQDMVRRAYKNPSNYDSEDFAFVMEYPRAIDLEELANLKVITEEERDVMLKQLRATEAETLQAITRLTGSAVATKAAPPQQNGSQPQEKDDLSDL
jgi:hypothetical protein